MFVSTHQLSCVLVLHICGIYVYSIEANSEVGDATVGLARDFTQKRDWQRQKLEKAVQSLFFSAQILAAGRSHLK